MLPNRDLEIVQEVQKGLTDENEKRLLGFKSTLIQHIRSITKNTIDPPARAVASLLWPWICWERRSKLYDLDIN